MYCLACGPEKISEIFEVSCLYSRSTTPKFCGDSHKWFMCASCGSIFRDKVIPKFALYREECFYYKNDYKKRVATAKKIINLFGPAIYFDIGSGGGIISNLLSQMGAKVIQVEPYRIPNNPLPFVKEDLYEFIQNRSWEKFVEKGEHVVFLLIDVVEHLSQSLNSLFDNCDRSKVSIYAETGCVDYAFPNKRIWYYLDYPDHKYVPSLRALKIIFGQDAKVERISNSLHRWGLVNSILRYAVHIVNKILFKFLKKPAVLLPLPKMNDHVAIIR